MDLEYKPTVDNITLTKELDEIVTASIKWILEKDLPAMKQMTRLQFWFRKAYDQGKIDSIKTATPEELMQNEHVKGLLECLKEISKTTYGTEWIIHDLEEYKSNYEIITRHFFSGQSKARAKLKEWGL